MIRMVTLLAMLALGACSTGDTLMPRIFLRIAPMPDSALLPNRFRSLLAEGAPAKQVGIVKPQLQGAILRDVVRDGIGTWISVDGASFSFDDGILVATRGQGGDLMASDVAQSAALIRARRAGRAMRFMTFLNGEGQAVTRSYVCDITDVGAEDIPFAPGVSVATRRMEEDCASADQQFTNLYWVRPDGRIPVSRQWAGDVAGPLVLRDLP